MRELMSHSELHFQVRVVQHQPGLPLVDIHGGRCAFRFGDQLHEPEEFVIRQDVNKSASKDLGLF